MTPRVKMIKFGCEMINRSLNDFELWATKTHTDHVTLMK